ncbi:hypothetical protein TNIN_243801 [Trichonephila inaurata madagascariensis]|uniref:Uncharacterized protein n=1 Tax=Trichonephila inaurata madagascariensis TaxID=2747483 RepID=A0A8X6XMB5_9ARAC|nr:hypothetical protein TNIN_243801 [Trichonephila inaurata madagascariensis]
MAFRQGKPFSVLVEATPHGDSALSHHSPGGSDCWCRYVREALTIPLLEPRNSKRMLAIGCFGGMGTPFSSCPKYYFPLRFLWVLSCIQKRRN